MLSGCQYTYCPRAKLLLVIDHDKFREVMAPNANSFKDKQEEDERKAIDRTERKRETLQQIRATRKGGDVAPKLNLVFPHSV